MARRRAVFGLPLAATLAAGCAAPRGVAAQEAPATAGPEPARLLVVTATAGFVHDSIPVARDVLRRLGAESGAFQVSVLPDVASLRELGPDLLGAHDAIFFVNTSGELPLEADQKRALLDFVASGRGFLGAHSASDTLYSWPEYGDLVGAYFRDHPWTQPVEVVVEDEGHPLTAGLGPSFGITEEIYVFRTDPRPRAHVLLRLQPASVGAAGDFPLAWCATYGWGRTYYTALGHFQEIWQDSRLQGHLLAAVRWATGRLAAASVAGGQ